tara:strand:+ start:1363 stop:2367 length:1005 start_codon:yes stop_codon:yes gene_type:complete
MIELSGIAKSFGRHPAVSDVGFALDKGVFAVLFGPSGCGKSTLLRMIAGLERPDHGTIAISGRLVSGDVHVPPESRQVGLVFQDLALFPNMTVAANIAFGLRGASGGSSRVEEMLKLLRLEPLRDRLPHELSGGEQQRVAVARSLAPDPDVLLLDEPFANLDAELRARVREELIEILKRTATTVIMVTHDREEALSAADELMVMIDGTLVQSGDSREVYEQPVNKEVGLLLGDGNLVEGLVRDEIVHCCLGEFPAMSHPDGACELFVRSEHIECSTDASLSARVVGGDYYGHDASASLLLADGTALSLRQAHGDLPIIGSQIGIRVSGPVCIFD